MGILVGLHDAAMLLRGWGGGCLMGLVWGEWLGALRRGMEGLDLTCFFATALQ